MRVEPKTIIPPAVRNAEPYSPAESAMKPAKQAYELQITPSSRGQSI